MSETEPIYFRNKDTNDTYLAGDNISAYENNARYERVLVVPIPDIMVGAPDPDGAPRTITPEQREAAVKALRVVQVDEFTVRRHDKHTATALVDLVLAAVSR